MSQDSNTDDQKTYNSISNAFRIEIKIADNINKDNDSSECISFNFTNKKTKQMYSKVFYVKDCKELLKPIPMMSILSLTKLLNDALTKLNKGKFRVMWNIDSSNDILNIKVIWLRKDDYTDDIIFKLLIQSKAMEPEDLLKLRIEDLEEDNRKLKKNIVPKGAIVMWSGKLRDIPQGWLLCDGSNDTPDLRARFIFGTDGNQYIKLGVLVIGNTTLTINQIPLHSHYTKVGTGGYSMGGGLQVKIIIYKLNQLEVDNHITRQQFVDPVNIYLLILY